MRNKPIHLHTGIHKGQRSCLKVSSYTGTLNYADQVALGIFKTESLHWGKGIGGTPVQKRFLSIQCWCKVPSSIKKIGWRSSWSGSPIRWTHCSPKWNAYQCQEFLKDTLSWASNSTGLEAFHILLLCPYRLRGGTHETYIMGALH